MNKNVFVFLGFALLFMFGILVWPGMYQYDKLDQKYPVKINRLTGATQVLSERGWVSVRDYKAPPSAPSEPPKDNNNNQATTSFASNTNINTTKYLWEVQNTKAEGDSLQVFVSGEVKNKGTKSNNATVVATLYDDNGAVSGSAQERLYNVPPDETMAFRLRVSVTHKGPWKNFKVTVQE